MAAVAIDRDEQDVRALAEAIRRGIASGDDEEQLETLARAALGDDDAVDPADDPEEGTWFG